MFDLVGGAITILKNMKVNGKDDNPYMKWKIKFMFQTTNHQPVYNSYAYIYIHMDFHLNHCNHHPTNVA